MRGSPMHEPAPRHLLDATMFWNTSGGIRRYINAKRRWAHENTDWRHTVANPTPDGTAQLCLPSLALPGSGGDYRLPLGRATMARLMHAQRPDLIEAADPYRVAWAALDAARALGVPAVAFCHSNLERMAMQWAPRPLHRLAARTARRYAARLYGHFDLVLAPSRAMVDQLADWGVPAAVHQPLGVDTKVFHPALRDPRWRGALGLPDEARLLVFSGRFAPEKNIDVLSAAVERLGAPYWLVAIGAGPVPPLGSRVIVLPPIAGAASLARALASCDLFVHAGRQETFGLSVLEAMACGLPVVAARADGLAELIDAGSPGEVHGASAAHFAQAIAASFETDRVAAGAAARRRAASQDWADVLPALWAHYRRLLRQSGAPASHLNGRA